MIVYLAWFLVVAALVVILLVKNLHHQDDEPHAEIQHRIVLQIEPPKPVIVEPAAGQLTLTGQTFEIRVGASSS